MDKNEVIELVEMMSEGLDQDELDELREEVATIKAVDPKLGALVERLVNVVQECSEYARSVREVTRG